MPMSVGVDLAKKGKHLAYVPGIGGESGYTTAVYTSADSLDALMERAGGPKNCDVIMEPTGMAWVLPCYYLASRGANPILADTIRASRFRKCIRTNVKSDSVDGLALSRAPSSIPESLSPLHPVNDTLFGLGRLVRQRRQFTKHEARIKQWTQSMLEGYYPGFESVFGSSGPFTSGGLFILQRFLNPKKVMDLGIEGVLQEATVAEVSNANTRPLFKRWYKKIESIWPLYENLIETDLCPINFDHVQKQTDNYLRNLSDTQSLVEIVSQDINALYDLADPDKVAMTLPGIGPAIAPIDTSLIQDDTRFPSVSKFMGWTGLTLRKNRTGDSDKAGQHIGKDGSSLFRWAMFLAAETARRYDLDFAAYYSQHKAIGQHHTKIVTDLAAKLSRRLYAVLKKAANGDSSGYKFYDQNGKEISKTESWQLCKELYPSEKAKKQKARTSTKKATKKATKRATQKARKKATKPEKTAKRQVKGSEHVPEPAEAAQQLDSMVKEAVQNCSQKSGKRG